MACRGRTEVSAGTEAARTWLFAPADRPERCQKALASAADQVIWDLEDGVAPAAGERARLALADLLRAIAPGGRRPWVRVHRPDTAEGREDLARLRALGALERLVVAKADAASVRALARESARGEWLLLVESARGLWDLVQGRLPLPPAVRVRLAFGALDYALDLGLAPAPDELELLEARSQVVRTSRVLGLPAPIDAVHPSFTDPVALARAARRSARLGFAGRLCIHPAQLEIVAEAFRPEPETVAWARRVLALARADGAGGAVALDGEMVDRPVVERARQVLIAAGERADAADRGRDGG